MPPAIFLQNSFHAQCSTLQQSTVLCRHAQAVLAMHAQGGFGRLYIIHVLYGVLPAVLVIFTGTILQHLVVSQI